MRCIALTMYRPPLGKGVVDVGDSPAGVDKSKRVPYVLSVKINDRHEINKNVTPYQ